MFTKPQPLAVKVKIEAYSVIYDAEWHSRDYRVADVAPPNRRRERRAPRASAATRPHRAVSSATTRSDSP